MMDTSIHSGLSRSQVVSIVLSTINAPYAHHVDADELARRITTANQDVSGPVFSFFSEVPEVLQDAFVELMGLNQNIVAAEAARYQALAGYSMALAK
jgi:hypothetical protein